MNSEPPIGDDLQRMLVSMKQHVLEHAAPRRRRGRRTGIVVAVITLLAVGTAGGGVALGLIPTTPEAAPASSPTATSQPSETVTPSSAPVIEVPTPIPTQTPTRPPYSAADWSTWTISADAIGPATLGHPTGADDAALRERFTPTPPLVDDTGAVLYPNGCPNQNSRIWDGPGGDRVVEVSAAGVVDTVIIEQGRESGDASGPPTTAEGVGLRSTLDEIRAAYPDVLQTRKDPAGGIRGTFWAVQSGDGRYIVFQIVDGETQVSKVYIGGRSDPEDDYCS